VVSVDVFNQRIAAVSMEPRAATASYDSAADRYTLHTGTQGVAGIRAQVAACLKIDAPKLRVLTNDVGGGFGMKASTYPEYPALLVAARKLGRTVHWAATRSESFMSDNQARDSAWQVSLALDADGKFLALRVEGQQNAGAYLTGVAVLVPTIPHRLLPAGPLSHSSHRGGFHDLSHQHRADRALSRRGPARSQLSARARG